MKKLYQVECCGKSCYSINTFSGIFVIAEDEKEAADKALAKMVGLQYNKVNDYVSSVKLVADEKETNKCLLILG